MEILLALSIAINIAQLILWSSRPKKRKVVYKHVVRPIIQYKVSGGNGTKKRKYVKSGKYSKKPKVITS